MASCAVSLSRSNSTSLAAFAGSFNWAFLARRQLHLITPLNTIFPTKCPFARGIPLFDTLAADLLVILGKHGMPPRDCIRRSQASRLAAESAVIVQLKRVGPGANVFARLGELGHVAGKEFQR